MRLRAPGGRRDHAIFDRKRDPRVFGKLKEAEVLGGVYVDPKDSKMSFERWVEEWWLERQVPTESADRQTDLPRVRVTLAKLGKVC